MPKGVKICLAAIIAVLAASVAAVILMNIHGHSQIVVIEREGKIIETLDLSREPDREFTITHPDGSWNTIVISGGTIRVSDADCPDHTCVKTGVLRNDGSPIVCLPHKLIIRFDDRNGVNYEN